MNMLENVQKVFIWIFGIIMLFGFGSMFFNALTSPSLEESMHDDPCTSRYLRQGSSLKEAMCACSEGKLRDLYCEDDER